jgi:hypothetical protein
MGREILEDETGLQATAMEPARPLCVLFIHPSGLRRVAAVGIRRIGLLKRGRVPADE